MKQKWLPREERLRGGREELVQIVGRGRETWTPQGPVAIAPKPEEAVGPWHVRLERVDGPAAPR